MMRIIEIIKKRIIVREVLKERLLNPMMKIIKLVKKSETILKIIGVSF